MLPLSRCRMANLTATSKSVVARSIISIALGIGVLVWANDAVATTNEVDQEYFDFVVKEITDRGWPCSAGESGHILYEDDLVTVLEVTCESGAMYEIIDVYSMESIVIEPMETITKEEIEEYLHRISYSIN
jgi:hypothetical protein